jgi:hypothetical protein
MTFLYNIALEILAREIMLKKEIKGIQVFFFFFGYYGLNLGPPAYWQVLYHLSHSVSPRTFKLENSKLY